MGSLLSQRGECSVADRVVQRDGRLVRKVDGVTETEGPWRQVAAREVRPDQAWERWSADVVKTHVGEPEPPSVIGREVVRIGAALPQPPFELRSLSSCGQDASDEVRQIAAP